MWLAPWLATVALAGILIAPVADYLQTPFAPLTELNLSPRPGRLTSPEVPEGALVDYPGAKRDFAERIWSRGMAGAYVDPVSGSPVPNWLRLRRGGL